MHVRDDEWEDFEAVLHQHGRSVGEFEVVASQQVQIVPGPHISGLRGMENQRRSSLGIQTVCLRHTGVKLPAVFEAGGNNGPALATVALDGLGFVVLRPCGIFADNPKFQHLAQAQVSN